MEDWYLAVESYLAALSLNPSYAEAISGLAQCYYALDEYDQALVRVREAKKFRQADAALANLEGYILIGLGDTAAAQAAFSSVLANRPNDVDARFGLALLDLRVGRLIDAERRYLETLRVSPGNARSLLSLSFVALDSGRIKEAAAYVEDALRFHAGEPRAHFAAAKVALRFDDAAWGISRAIMEAETALELKPNYGDARRLLASLLYSKSEYARSALLMEEAVKYDRNDAAAWYTLALSKAALSTVAPGTVAPGTAAPGTEAQGLGDEAIYAFETAISLRPDDELARIALENFIMDSKPLEDAMRSSYADERIRIAAAFASRNEFDRAIFEYRRALRVYPYAKKGREGYAEILRLRGRLASYFAELDFLREIGKADGRISDEIENYASILVDSVSNLWRTDQFALAKRPYKIMLFSAGNYGAPFHTASDSTMARYVSELFSSSSLVALDGQILGAQDFAFAFKTARESGAAWFGMVKTRETERDISLTLDLFVARTGAPAATFSAFASGNDRVAKVASRIMAELVSSIPLRGSIISRNGERVLVDLGKNDGIAKDEVFLVLKNGSLAPDPAGLGIAWKSGQVLGTLTITNVDEELSEGILKRSGFFDEVNVRDEIVRKPPDSPQPTGAQPTAAKPLPVALPPVPELFPATYYEVQRLF